MQFPSKLPQIGTTIFTEMSALARRHQAINLGQGYPDYQPDQGLIDAVHEAMCAGHNQYAPMAGVPELREAISAKVTGQHGRHYDPDAEITVTSGASEALMSSFLALVQAGDEVIIIDPSYDLYAPAIILAGGTPVRVLMRPPTAAMPSYQLDWNAVQAAVTPKTRMLVLNFPHNPTGLILHEQDLDALEHIVAQCPQLLILSDEAYEYILFDEQEHLSPVRRETLVSHCVLICSFGKTFNATGWKVGYCCAPATIMAEIRKVHQFVVFSVSTPIQYGIATHLAQMPPVTALAGFYQKKRDRLTAGLHKTPLKPLHSAGTFFLLVDASRLGSGQEKQLALDLLLTAGVASIPVSAFYEDPRAEYANHNLLRLCFAKQDATLDAAVERLQQPEATS